MSFKDLGLMPELLAAVTEHGYKTATPIQKKSIPEILAGNDILAGAQTGTGKTAAFALPLLQLLNDSTNRGRSPRALILAPTRELAAQVLDFIEIYGKKLSLRSTVVFGGVSINPQKQRLIRGIDILVATPGRLLDHLRQRSLSLSQLEILVLDEADRMLDMGFIHDIRKILKYLPQKRQNLLFSATYSDEIKMLASRILDKPKLIEVATKKITADTISQVIYPVERKRKKELLTKLIKENKWKQVLVFTRTKHGANRLAGQLLRSKILAVAIHGNKSQGARTRALADFKSGEVQVLIATDIAARGLDISFLPHVINYDLPEIPENYVHRIGRTGRAGINGKAISFVSPEDHKELKDIQKLLNYQIPRETIEGFEVDLSIIPPKADPKLRANNANNAQKPEKKITKKAIKKPVKKDTWKRKDSDKKNGIIEPKRKELRGKRANKIVLKDEKSNTLDDKQKKKSNPWRKKKKIEQKRLVSKIFVRPSKHK